MSRQEEVAQERRRRQPGTLDRGAQLKLQVPQSVRDKFPNSDFRFINDVGTRMHDKTVADDWSKVDESLSKPIPVGTDDRGQPIIAYLCEKPKAYIEEDRKEALKGIAGAEAEIMKGQHNSPDALKDAYVPANATNKITPGYEP